MALVTEDGIHVFVSAFAHLVVPCYWLSLWKCILTYIQTGVIFN